MDEHAILEEILGLLEANSVKTRREPLGGSGGELCKIKGETVLFLDTQSQPSELAALCAEAVPKVVDIEKVYIRPEVRKFIESRICNRKE